MIRILVSLTAASLVLTGYSAGEAFGKSQDSDRVGTVAAAPASLGKQVFDEWCAECHAAGPRYPGTASLQVRDNGAIPAALEERDNLTPEIVEFFVRQGVMVMPPFRKTEITDAELAALGAYLSRRPEPAIAPES